MKAELISRNVNWCKPEEAVQDIMRYVKSEYVADSDEEFEDGPNLKITVIVEKV